MEEEGTREREREKEKCLPIIDTFTDCLVFTLGTHESQNIEIENSPALQYIHTVPKSLLVEY